jgi:tripartite-type tricarboxylate transporter receptor subunit TctC
MMRKKVLVGVTLLVVLCVLAGLKSFSTVVPSETEPVSGVYPDRNVYGTIVYAPGGACDTFARALVPLVQKELGQTIILNNVVGGSGAIAVHQVYNQVPDGYNLLFGAEGQQLFPLLGVSDLSYNDFIPVAIYASCNGVVFVSRDSPYDSLEELENAILENPGKIKWLIRVPAALPMSFQQS